MRHEFPATVDEECRMTNIISIIDGKLIFKRKRYVKGKGRDRVTTIYVKEKSSKRVGGRSLFVGQTKLLYKIGGSNEREEKKWARPTSQSNRALRFEEGRDVSIRDKWRGKKKKYIYNKEKEKKKHRKDRIDDNILLLLLVYIYI